MSQEWKEELSEKYTWSNNQPGPKDVVEEAKEYDFESISTLISKMEDAPSNCSTGFEKWKWFRNYGRAFGMGKDEETNS